MKGLDKKHDYEWNLYFGAGPETRRFARRLRKELTPAEALLWNEIRAGKTGYKFRRQHPLGKYIADFYCHELKLVIELDGGIHFKPDQKERDENRTFNLQMFGLKVIRFSNNEIEESMDFVLKSIKSICISLAHLKQL